ncbi:MAG: hypothetical protein WA093_00785 [Minisyncoccales bacterium]
MISIFRFAPGGKDNSYRGICHKIAGIKARGRNQALAAGKKTCLDQSGKPDLKTDWQRIY